jgi:hypothetical protein
MRKSKRGIRVISECEDASIRDSKTFERRSVTDQHPVDHFNLIYDHDTQPSAPSSLSRRRAAFPSSARKDAERARVRLLTQLEPTSKRVGKNRLDTDSTLAVNIFNNSNFFSLCVHSKITSRL